MNFGSLVLRDGIVRRANSSPPMPTPRIPTSTSEAMDDLSYEVIDAALEVQHLLGPGLLRSAYEAALAHEMKLRGLRIEQRLPANLLYREQLIPSAKEISLVVEGRLMIASVCANKIEPIHLARQRSLLKAARIEEGICLNFHAESIAAEVKRFSLISKP